MTPDGRTYCERGAMRFVIEPTKTWLSAPWMDLSWMEHMTEGMEEGVDSSDAIRRVLADIMSLIGTRWMPENGSAMRANGSGSASSVWIFVRRLLWSQARSSPEPLPPDGRLFVTVTLFF